jgi:hypothetical protein
MINFFRKTRKKMADDNKPMKYMRYAIGEIVLVVVGILIALSINNWNEERNNRIKEKILLTNLIENIQTNIDHILEDISTHRDCIRSSEIAIDAIRNNKPFYDSLVFYFHRAPIFPDPKLSTSSYESLASTGFDILSDDIIRKEIVELFEVIYPNRIDRLFRISNLVTDFSVSFYLKNFERNNGMARPNNYSELIGNQEYINILVMTKSLHGWSIELKSECLKESNRILKMIEAELD